MRSSHWATIKTPRELQTKGLPCNRWNMVYKRSGLLDSWHCMACRRNYTKEEARSHYCHQEEAGREWSGRPGPDSRGQVQRKKGASRLGQVLSWFRG